jgi:hypothetical protein
MSAKALAEYLILRPNEQDNVLHNARFLMPPVVRAYAYALDALRAYNANPARSINILDDAKRIVFAASQHQSSSARKSNGARGWVHSGCAATRDRESSVVGN